MVVLALTACNFFGLLSPHFPKRPDFLPQSSIVCEGRIARMSEERLRGTRLWVDELFCQDGNMMRNVAGMAQVTVMGGAAAPLINDVIRFRSHLHTPHRYYNPGAIDWERKLIADGVTWTGAVENAEWMTVVRNGGWSPSRAIDVWRQRLSRQIATIQDDNLRGTTAALLLGNAGQLPEKFGDGLRYLGIIHLYVISGLHVAAVAWAVYELLYWFLSRRARWALRYPLWRWAATGSLMAVWIYVGLVGGGVAVVRSGIMVSVYLAALILDRHPHVGAAIALAALLLILQSPHVIFIPGFQLSFAAVMALVMVYPRVMQWVNDKTGDAGRRSPVGVFAETGYLRAAGPALKKAIAAALVATWATAPIVAYHFHQTPLLGIPANLIAGPYTTIILMPLGFVWTLLAGIPHVSGFLQAVWMCAATPLVRGIEWATPLAESTQWTFTPSVWEVLWWYSVVIPAVLPHRGNFQRESSNEKQFPVPRLKVGLTAGVTMWCVLGFFLIVLRVYNSSRPHPLQLTFLDIGQGASVLVEFPNRHTMLIDGGGVPGSDFDVGRWVVAPTLLARGITRVDDLVLTHPHPDHYGGLAYVTEHFHPRHFFTNGSTGEEGDEQWQAFMGRMQATGLLPEVLHRDMQWLEGDVQLIWRHPPPTGPDESQGKNNGSLVTEIRYGDFRALIVGDIQKEAELLIVRDTDVGTVSVMQVPHHASRTSSTVEFLQRVHPQLAVAQLGFENRYGFPHAEVLRRYDELGIPLCKTDRDGAITITAYPNADSPTTRFSIQRESEVGTCSAHAR